MFVIGTARLTKRKDDMPDHFKFGYKAMLEKEAIRKELLESGWDANSFEFLFEVDRIYIEHHKNDPSLYERQALLPKPPVVEDVLLSTEEMEYLVFKLEGVNDPIGVSALTKLKKILSKWQ